MQFLGDYRIDDYITFGAQLHRFSSGAVYAPTGNVTYTFYENNSTTGAPTGGNLAQLNSKTGLYTARVQLTTASSFEAGKEYLVHIEATVDGVAAGELLMFRIIGNPKVDVDTIKTNPVVNGGTITFPTNKTLAATDNITAATVSLANGAHGGAAATITLQTPIAATVPDTQKVDVNTIKTQAVTCAAGVTVLASVGTAATSTAQTGDSFARLGAPAGASVSADILAVDNLVDDLESRLGTPSNLGSGATVAANLADIEGQTDDIGVAGAGLTALATQASVNTIDDFLDTEIASLTTELAKVPKSDGTSSWNATALAALQSEANDALVAQRLDELLNADSDIDGAAPPTVGSVFHELLTKTAGSFTYDQSTDSLEAVRDNMGTAQTGDAYAVVNNGTYGNAALETLVDDLESRLGTPSNLGSGATVAANLADIEAETDEIGVAGAGLTAIAVGVGGIQSTSFAAGAVDAAALAADAGTEIATAVLAKTIAAESYAADAGTPTLSQILWMIWAGLVDFSISGTTLTVKKQDGTAAMTFTLDDATNPTSRTRAT